MNDPTSKTAPTDAPAPTRRGLFDQTWEVELLISGALVFALLGAPGRIEAWWDRVSVIAAGDLRMTYFFVFYYASLLAYALIATFVLHIGARAYWVGLAGLHSVYPDGINWEALQKRGPIGMALSRRLVPSLENAVTSADGFCRLIFAFAAILVMNLVLSVLAMIAFGVPSFLIVRYLLPDANIILVAGLLFAVTFLIPFAGAGLLDRRMRDRIAPDSGLGRTIRFLLRIAYYLSLGPILHPLILTISTRTSQRRFSAILQTIGTAVVVMFLVRNWDLLSDGGPMHSFLVEPGAASSAELRPEYYADQRPAGSMYPRAPVIPSELIESAYLRLFIPYYPHRDNDLLRERCTEFLDSAEGPADDVAAARCVGGLYTISLNGGVLGDLYFDFASDPASGMRGVATRIPVSDLAPGRHELRLERVLAADEREEIESDHAASDDPDRGTLAEAIEDARRVHVIPFWR